MVDKQDYIDQAVVRAEFDNKFTRYYELPPTTDSEWNSIKVLIHLLTSAHYDKFLEGVPSNIWHGAMEMLRAMR
eukprot:5210175-Prorocentrum_lima.AAC.1